MGLRALHEGLEERRGHSPQIVQIIIGAIISMHLRLSRLSDIVTTASSELASERGETDAILIPMVQRTVLVFREVDFLKVHGAQRLSGSMTSH